MSRSQSHTGCGQPTGPLRAARVGAWWFGFEGLAVVNVFAKGPQTVHPLAGWRNWAQPDAPQQEAGH